MKNFTAIENNFYLSANDKILSIKGNSNTDKICFTVNRFCNSIDLSECTCTIKTKNQNNLSDIIIPEIDIEDNFLNIIWQIKSATTSSSGDLKVQIQFEKLFEAEEQQGDTITYDESRTIVWQSNVMVFQIKENLASADEVYEQQPSLFQQWESRMSGLLDDAANNTFVKVTEKNSANGVAALNSNAKLTSSQLDTSTNAAKIQLANLSDEVISAINTASSTSVSDGSVTEAKLASGAVSTAKLADSSITEAKLASGAVSTAKLADSSITEAKLASGAVSTAKLADSSVTGAKIADGSVSASKLAAGCLSAAEPADGSISTAKLANSSVTEAKLANSCVSPEKTNFLDLKRLNYIDNTKLTKGYITNSGVISDHSNNNIYTTDFIAVTEGKTYCCNLSWNGGYYNSNKEFIQSFSTIDMSSSYERKFKIPTGLNIAYIRLVGDCINNIPVMNDGYELTVNSSYDTIITTISDSYLRKDILTHVTSNNAILSKLYGTLWGCLGDGITNTSNVDTPYYNIIKSKYAMGFKSYSYANSQIAYTSDNTKRPMVSRYTNMSSNLEIITVFGGTNDFANQVTLGTISSSDNTTFYGALNELCAGLINRYPGRRIGFITPLQRNGSNDNSLVIPLSDYVKAIKDVCNKYSIPVLDLYNEGGLCPLVEYIKNNYFYVTDSVSDGIHPNSLGHEVIARKIESFLLTL